MRHHDRQRKFGRRRDQRRALLRGLAAALIRHGRIRTTEAKAKSLRPLVEKLVSQARRAGQPGIAAQRLVLARLGAPLAARKLIQEIAPRYTRRAGGYTRISKLEPRSGDGSPMAIIEFV